MVGAWQELIRSSSLTRHRELVGRLRSEHGPGHGHANALVAATLAEGRRTGPTCDAGAKIDFWHGCTDGRARRREGSGTVGAGKDLGPGRGMGSRTAQADRGAAHGRLDRADPRRARRAGRAGAAAGRRGDRGDGRDVRDPREATPPAGPHPRHRAAGGARLGHPGHTAEPVRRRG
ncbi:protein of unknown function [Streptomyces murinus]